MVLDRLVAHRKGRQGVYSNLVSACTMFEPLRRQIERLPETPSKMKKKKNDQINEASCTLLKLIQVVCVYLHVVD